MLLFVWLFRVFVAFLWADRMLSLVNSSLPIMRYAALAFTRFPLANHMDFSGSWAIGRLLLLGIVFLSVWSQNQLFETLSQPNC